MTKKTVQNVLHDVSELQHEWGLHYKIFNVSVNKITYSVTIECYRNSIKFYESALLRIDGINTVFTCRDVFKYARVTGHIDKALKWD